MRLRLLPCCLLLAAPVLFAQDQQMKADIDSRFEQLHAIQQFGNDYMTTQPRMLFFPSPDIFNTSAKISKTARKELEKGNQELAKNRFDEAQKHFAAAVKAEPNFAVGHLNLGVAELNLHQLDEARTEFDTAAKLEPTLANAYLDIGVLEIQRRNFAAAETSLKSANRLAPTDLKTLTLLAFTEALNKEYEVAIATAERVHAAKQHEGYAYAHMVEATAYQSTGRTQQAIAEYELFLKENPKDPRAGVARKALQDLQAQTDAPK